MEIADVSQVDDVALKRAGAAGTMKTGGNSVQVVYGTNVQFVKDAMERVKSGEVVVDTVEPERAQVTDTATATLTRTTIKLRQPVEGKVVPLSAVPDATFAQEIMGPGLAIEPTGSTVVAPADGTIGATFETSHAIALVLDDGTELLIHVGIDTVEMKGDGFRTLVAKDARVTAGTPLLEFDLQKIAAAGHPAITPVIVLNNENAQIEFKE